MGDEWATVEMVHLSAGGRIGSKTLKKETKNSANRREARGGRVDLRKRKLW